MRPLLCLGLLIVAAARPSGSDVRRYEAVEPHMGTLVRITIYAQDEQSATRAFRAAFDRIHDLDRILSDYRADSELNTIAKTAVGRPVAISDDLFTVLQASQDLAHATGGAFDVTQGPAIRLWREARASKRVPDPGALKDAASRSGFRKLRLDVINRTVTLDVPGMALDVGALGKGYAASEALEVLRRSGIRSALVALSGDLAFSEAPPGRRGWRIAIHSDSSRRTVPNVLELTQAAVSTAGSSEQYVDVGGRRYSHIINPGSGMGLVDDLTVTVIARHGVEADGLDTAVSVLGVDRGLALIESRPGAAALITRRTEAGVTLFPSSRLRELASR